MNNAIMESGVQKKLVDSAVKVFAQKGYRDAKIAAIVKGVGANRSTAKQEVVDHFVETQVSSIFAALETLPHSFPHKSLTV